MATTPPDTLTLNGSGAITDAVIDPTIEGLLTLLIVNKNGQTNNPVITIKDSGTGRTLLDAITQSASGDVTYAVREEWVDNDNVSTGLYNLFYVDSPLTLTVTGGDNAGTVSVRFQYMPMQG